METTFRISQHFVDANDENQVIEPVLRLLVDLTGATGAAFVPLDEHGQPQTALSHGELPFPVMDAWLEYLTTRGVRDRCRECEAREPVELPDGTTVDPSQVLGDARHGRAVVYTGDTRACSSVREAARNATLLVHARGTQILPEEYRPRIFGIKTPNSFNTFLVDGQVAGTWRHEDGRIALVASFTGGPIGRGLSAAAVVREAAAAAGGGGGGRDDVAQAGGKGGPQELERALDVARQALQRALAA